MFFALHCLHRFLFVYVHCATNPVWQNADLAILMVRHIYIPSQGSMVSFSSHLISSHLISSHLISSHLISSHLISSHLIPAHTSTSNTSKATMPNNRNSNRNRNSRPNCNDDCSSNYKVHNRNHTGTYHFTCSQPTTVITTTTTCHNFCSRNLVWNPFTNFWICDCGSYKSYYKPDCEVCGIQYSAEHRGMVCVRCDEWFQLD
jgi:hypothetical protein